MHKIILTGGKDYNLQLQKRLPLSFILKVQKGYVKKIVTLGEIMLRLSTPDFKRFVQADSFDVTYGGGEANVAAALCNYGLNGTFITKVPDNAIGQSAT